MRKKARSLLDEKSVGGGDAQHGFGYQDDFVISRIPCWIADSGFVQLKQEGIEDVEISFYVPGVGKVIDVAQVKNLQLTPMEFRNILLDFFELSQQGTFRDFCIVARSISRELQPVVNGLSRLKNHYSDYIESEIGAQSIDDFRNRVEGLGLEPSLAEFLLLRVTIIEMGHGDGDGRFHNAVSQYLPEFDTVSRGVLVNGLAKLRQLIHTQKNRRIMREEIENCLYSEEAAPQLRPVEIGIGGNTQSDHTPLALNWEEFFNFDAQRYPTIEQWQDVLLPQLRSISAWMLTERTVRRVRIHKHAISTAVAVGLVFKSVAGFDIDVEHNNEIWSTSDLPDNSASNTFEYELETFKDVAEDSDQLVIAIGIGRDIFSHVDDYVAQSDLEGASKCYLFWNMQISSAKQANALVGTIKQEIDYALKPSGIKCIHLFYAGPAHLATFIGHRLNATATIRCYEWHNTLRGYFPAWRI